jgi:hypothetical protein
MESEKEKIPLFGSWKRWYILVLAVLLIQIVLYFLLTRSY